METAIEFLESKHKNIIKNNYRTSDGEHVEHCVVIAMDMAARLLNEGRKPTLLAITGYLIPQPFNGRIEWGGHTICVADEMVYDPIFDRPVPLSRYYQKAFPGQEIEVEEQLPLNSIRNYFAKSNSPRQKN
ncbi:MAG: hypothetical protein IIA87_04765 [Nanoarchaeota archaeon]|nr:hypothetical protein [Nanoarchaeota archaeon]